MRDVTERHGGLLSGGVASDGDSETDCELRFACASRFRTLTMTTVAPWSDAGPNPFTGYSGDEELEA